MMTRFVLATTAVYFTFAALAGPAGAPALGKVHPVYVKIIWPVDPADPLVNKKGPIVESWIAKSIKDRPQVSYRAVTAWVPLVELPCEPTDVWDGKVDDTEQVCAVVADIVERKEGKITIVLRGWGPGGGRVAVTLDDEPGSREVAPVTDAKTELGIPHVAIMIGP